MTKTKRTAKSKTSNMEGEAEDTAVSADNPVLNPSISPEAKQLREALTEKSAEYPTERPPWVTQFQSELTQVIEAKLLHGLKTLEQKIDKKLDDVNINIQDLTVKHDHGLQQIQQAESIAQQACNEVTKIREALNLKSAEVEHLKNDLEDLRNRSMRKTLIFYGFPEKPNETWDDCIQTLEEHIEACGFEERVQIDRAHRANRRNDARNRSDPRPIIAEFVTWQDSNYILSNSNKLSKKGSQDGSTKDLNIKVQQLFGKKTSEERGKMLKIRKFFLLQNKKWKISLAYPATLYINKGNGFKRYQFNAADLQNAEDYFDKLNNK